jgi:alanine dehydrogenase
MNVGVLRETKQGERRVVLVPAAVRALVEAGHRVLVESGAGAGSGFGDEEYSAVGAKLGATASDVIESAEIVTKVKEPTPSEIAAMRAGQVWFDFLHLAPNPSLTRQLLEREIVGISFDTVQCDDGRMPILAPMSEVAGRLAVQIGARLLQADQGGRGVLLGGLPGVPRGRVVVLGAGTVGAAAVRMAVGLGAEVTVIDVDVLRMGRLFDLHPGAISTLYSGTESIEGSVVAADLVVGAVLVAGTRTPVLVTRDMVRRMARGSVIVDVAIDQGGCVETMRPTSHAEPTYTVDDVIHYGVPNMPGCVPRTSTHALSNAVLPFLLELCDKGVDEALRTNGALARGTNCYRGQVTHEAIARGQGHPLAVVPWR